MDGSNESGGLFPHDGEEPHRGEASDPERGIDFYTRKWVRPEDLNPHGTLFGGSLLRWIDEEAAIYAVVQLGNERVVTKLISEVNFEASATQGDLIEMGLIATDFGRTSITMRAEVRNMITRRTILTIERIVFVNLGADGRPAPHGYTGITYGRERLPASRDAVG
ncbi:acyl-CoA thioesterase [Leucobacter soli]|uniref:HotDog ACOT-type domain-containing protein n=1 Tax=Leucobacter soli TaxID=2812850 RepID=A0A916JT02_9MICO|nr:hotdog domain-containing protein [Leucobacter soli]CAG7600708.1 hypothetical protein LEUCIP111803_00393 [Leucobacter soli]